MIDDGALRAYYDGKEAYDEGLPSTANPHDLFGHEMEEKAYLFWRDGWNAARFADMGGAVT